jgi:hypothetical protein
MMEGLGEFPATKKQEIRREADAAYKERDRVEFNTHRV